MLRTSKTTLILPNYQSKSARSSCSKPFGTALKPKQVPPAQLGNLGQTLQANLSTQTQATAIVRPIGLKYPVQVPSKPRNSMGRKVHGQSQSPIWVPLPVKDTVSMPWN